MSNTMQAHACKTAMERRLVGDLRRHGMKPLVTRESVARRSCGGIGNASPILREDRSMQRFFMYIDYD